MSIVPPCAFMISFVILSPSPVPAVPFFVVKNGCMILSFISLGMPGPLSSISMMTLLDEDLVRTTSLGLYPPSPPIPLPGERGEGVREEQTVLRDSLFFVCQTAIHIQSFGTSKKCVHTVASKGD